jgi:hypothetical protein
MRKIVMTGSDSKAILDGLMARRGNSPEFILELEGYMDDLANGELDAADDKYIRQLAKRLGGGGGSEPVVPPQDDAHEDDAHEDEEYEDDETDDETEDDRFARAKAAFHQRFHPDNLDADAPDATLRREIFEEYWAELERIENED